MAFAGAGSRIDNEVRSWADVVSGEHRFGGIEYRIGRREFGHRHGDSLVDIPFPMAVRNQLVSSGRADKHHIYPESGWISVHINAEADVENAVGLLRMSYDIAMDRIQKRNGRGDNIGRMSMRED